ncbi:hypothetical protein O6H91_01G105700 [Diphasiastrum complanatum]|uniref:Uncharacterized protein n=1 Tax=Diphasiastrum complanatum TaxID=34168 RepID=A0ACC2EUB4_DIPCM|nr:hypothetical protein O6H91_01G105700 [Diphasiastrum complanatum]
MELSRPSLLPSCALIFLALLASPWWSVHSAEDVVITKVDRRIDLTSHIVRTSASIRFENKGSSDTTKVLFALSSAQAERLAYLAAIVLEGKGKSKTQSDPVAVSQVSFQSAPRDIVLYSFSLNKPLKRGESAIVEVNYVLTHVLKPFPEEIKQSDVQLVVYLDNAYLLSPYVVKVQTTTFKLPRSRVESFTKLDASRLADSELKYGPYENVAAFSHQPVTVHFENNQPFAVIKELQREIEISHWGNVYVTENYHLMHGGARHKGTFSRLDYQARPSASGVAAFNRLFAKLPPRAHSVYYRDEIGNISTSHLRSDNKRTDLLLEPRYPLFGGWQVTFTLGYGVPISDFLFYSKDGQRFLDFTFGSPISNAVVDKLVVKVVLPEGSKDPVVSVPFPVEITHERKYSYLDTVGRTVVVLRKENVVPEHDVHFQVYYKFNNLALLAEPLMLVFGIFCFFIACIAYMHFDFSISKSSASYQARLQREEVADAIQRLQKVMNVRAAVTDKLDASLRDLARTGDVASCKAARKAAEATLKETAKEVKSIQEALQASSRAASVLLKVDSLIQKEKEKQDKLLQKHSLTVELYERKLSSKDIDNRIAPYQQKLLVLTQEVSDLLHAIDD